MAVGHSRLHVVFAATGQAMIKKIARFRVLIDVTIVIFIFFLLIFIFIIAHYSICNTPTDYYFRTALKFIIRIANGGDAI